MAQEVGSEALEQLSTKFRPNKRYKTDRKDLDGGSIQLLATVNDILTDPQKYKKYQQDLAKYAWEQAQIFGYRGTLGQFLTALGFADIVPMKGTTNLDLARIMTATPGSALTTPTGSGILNKGEEKLTKSGVAGSPWHVEKKLAIDY